MVVPLHLNTSLCENLSCKQVALLVHIVTAAEVVLTALDGDLLASVGPGAGRGEVLLLRLLLAPVLLAPDNHH